MTNDQYRREMGVDMIREEQRQRELSPRNAVVAIKPTPKEVAEANAIPVADVLADAEHPRLAPKGRQDRGFDGASSHKPLIIND